MSEQNIQTRVGLSFDDSNLDDPLAWIEGLSFEDLRLWLRGPVWTGDTLPVVVPGTSSVVSHLIDLFSKASPRLLVKLREIIPDLLREWGRNDSFPSLRDLLFLCGTLRCVAAEPTIVLVLTERLRDRPDEVELRQVCLSVLSGFGCTERTADVFRRYIVDINYTALCYRALYRFDLQYAATEFQSVLEIYTRNSALLKLKGPISLLLFETLESSQRANFWKRFLTLSAVEPQDLVIAFDMLQSIGIEFLPGVMPSGVSEVPDYVEVGYEEFAEGASSKPDRIHLEDLSYRTVSAICGALESNCNALIATSFG